jgi:phosphopantothenoylcysteine decarboxylase/phosphopantothenate--cysteine ligase
MLSPLEGKKVLLGVSGSIAAYKSAELVRQLQKKGAEVQVLMTPDAGRFITPLTLGALSKKDVLVEIFPEHAGDSWTRHIHLGLWADLYVIAPASAQTIAKLAHGFCDNMLTAAALSSRCPLLICPAMDHDMYVHPATQANIKILRNYGYGFLPPAHGELASGLVGTGRLPEPEEILERIEADLAADAPKDDVAVSLLAGKTVVVTAGPTREALDPVRYITNHSTGTMGYKLAAAAHRRGGVVTLISGPTALNPPEGITYMPVVSAADMAEAVFQHRQADLIVMAAAVADYTPARASKVKIKKNEGDLNLALHRTTDILAELGQSKKIGQVLVGFALETDDQLANARLKLKKKNLDWVVLNSPNFEGEGFGTATNRVTLLSSDGREEALPLLPKLEVAEALLDRVESSFAISMKDS